MVYLARIEYLPMGIFRDYSEADFARTKSATGHRCDVLVFRQGADRDRGMIGLTLSRTAARLTITSLYVDANVQSAWVLGDFGVRVPRRGHARRSVTIQSPLAAIQRRQPHLHPRDRDGAAQWSWLDAASRVPDPEHPLRVRRRVGRSFKPTRREGPPASTDKLRGPRSLTSWYFARHPFKIQADVSQIWEEVFAEGATSLPLCNSRCIAVTLLRLARRPRLVLVCFAFAACKPAHTHRIRSQTFVLVHAKPRCEKLGVVEGVGGNAEHAQGRMHSSRLQSGARPTSWLEPAHPDLEDGMTIVVTGTVFAAVRRPDQVFPPDGYR